jgi:hypothetical protein
MGMSARLEVDEFIKRLGSKSGKDKRLALMING